MKLGIELKKLFERDLDRLNKELGLYTSESKLWTVREEISNSAGNLGLHLCGNLKHFIGAILMDSGYERDRPFEFSGNVPLEELTKNVEETKNIVGEYLTNVSESDFHDEFPLQPFGYPITTSEFVFHLYGHLNYHLGQINYHRRLIS